MDQKHSGVSFSTRSDLIIYEFNTLIINVLYYAYINAETSALDYVLIANQHEKIKNH